MSLTIDLSGHTALVTGAAGALGSVIAVTLARCGADVAVHYFHNKNSARHLCEEITSLGRKTCSVSADVGSFDEISTMAAQINAAVGAPDIIVANAVSQIHPWKTILEEELSDYVDQFRTCVLHTVHLAKVFVPAMMKKKWGRFIAINSECAMQTDVTQSAYASAKRGMDGILRVLAKEVGSFQITVNQVAPGWTITDRDRKNKTEVQLGYARTVPLARRGTDQEVSNVVAFLASDLASFITGGFIPVCGGTVMPAI
ncbi:MAG: SDR family oxidoreductase [Chitinivibrionales bacterium]|nr:SDR family oxidoreductase [Chitinivibrionales bacterium]